MSLNRLPAELTAHVVSYLAELETTDGSPYGRRRTSISQYASTSLDIQYAIEKRHFTRLDITSDDIPAFEKYVSESQSRRALLRILDFRPILPAYSQNMCARFERPSDRRANNKAFSDTIQMLFSALLPFEKDSKSVPLHLNITTPHSTSDPGYRVEPFGDKWGNVDNELSNARFAHSILHLDRQAKFRSLDRLTGLSVGSGGPRFMAPSPVFSLLQSFPNVTTLHLEISDNEKMKAALRKRLRLEFAQALTCQRSEVLSDLRLEYLHESPVDHRTTNADVRDTTRGSTSDPLSFGLSQFISSCETLANVSLSGPICVDETLFWPPPASAGNSLWADIETYFVDLSSVRPDGGWYLDEHYGFPREEPSRDCGLSYYSDEDLFDSNASSVSYTDEPSAAEDDILPPDNHSEWREALRTGDAYWLQFRSQPNEHLERVWKASARAAALMPKLEMMGVQIKVESCPRTNGESQDFDFTYYAKGMQILNSDVIAHVPQLHWNAPSEWKMDEGLELLWRNVLGPVGDIRYDYW